MIFLFTQTLLKDFYLNNYKGTYPKTAVITSNTKRARYVPESKEGVNKSISDIDHYQINQLEENTYRINYNKGTFGL